MKKTILLALALVLGMAASAQSDYYFQKCTLFDALPIRSNDIVFIGNSITDGGEWAELFDNRHVRNRGISGDMTEWMLGRLDSIIAGHPKKLFLMIGTNDLAVGVEPDAVVANIRKIIDRFRKESPWTKVYVQSILPVNGKDFSKHTRHYIHTEDIVRINRQLEALCADQKNLFYLDVHSALIDGDGLLDKRYTNDGLHLMGAGYLVWREVIKPYVR